MESHKTDTAYSWLVAFCASVIYFIQYGFHRMAGIFFAESILYFHTTREQASYPYTLANTMNCFAGPIAGFLYQILGLRKVLLLGTFMSSLGIGLCFLATDILTVTIFWGLFYGIGGNIATLMLLQALNLYFKKNTSKACGLALAGASFSGLVLPSLCQILMKAYGLAGTYLIVSAVALHCIPAAMLIRNPVSNNPDKISSKSDIHLKSYGEEVKRNDSEKDLPDAMDQDKDGFGKCQLNNSSNGTQTKDEMANSSSEKCKIGLFLDSMKLSNVIHKAKGNSYDFGSVVNESESDDKKASNYFKAYENKTIPKLKEYKVYVIQSTQPPPPPSENENQDFCNKSSERIENNSNMPKSNRFVEFLRKFKHLIQPFKVFSNPSYILLALVSASTFYSYVLLLSFIVDYSRDKGISTDDSKYLFMASGSFDMLSKLGFGWITDNGYVTRKNYHIACSLFRSITLAMIVWSQGFLSLLICLSVEGFCFGGCMSVMPALICSYVKKEEQAVAMASYPLSLLPLYISSSSIIGYFRDTLGSYDVLVYVLMSITLAQVVSLLSLPLVDKWRQKKLHPTETGENKADDF